MTTFTILVFRLIRYGNAYPELYRETYLFTMGHQLGDRSTSELATLADRHRLINATGNRKVIESSL